MRPELYAHQRAAVEKMSGSRVGALFMEMGTGKSRVVVELARLRRGRIGRVIWFTPVALKATVAEEIRKHEPDARVYVFDAATRPGNLPEAFWYVVGIESMSSSRRVALAVNALITADTFVVVDESSYIKNHAAKRTVRITDMSARARYRIILTGTPLSQGVVDLYGQMRFLSEKILGYRSFHSFARNHLEYSEKYPGMVVRAHNVGYLAAKIAPYVYQVTKEECLELPEKTHQTYRCEMSHEQRDAYKRAKDEILFDLDTVDEFDRFTILRLFGALQQIVCGFWRRNSKSGRVIEEYRHERLDLFEEVVGRFRPGTKAIVWAKYRYDVRGICRCLRAGYGDESVAEFHGGLSERARDAEIGRWRPADGARFLVATGSCGSHGLNLTEAEYAVFYSNTFKYAERQQAEARCHRIGQEKKVVYVDLVCQGSIDERIQRSLWKKEDTVDAFKREVDKVKDRGQWKKLVEGL